MEPHPFECCTGNCLYHPAVFGVVLEMVEEMSLGYGWGDINEAEWRRIEASMTAGERAEKAAKAAAARKESSALASALSRRG